MSSKLKQAIAATRAGQSKEAQILLTQVLKENPNQVQAWYLLSLLVDSPAKQQAYLQKVVALDPTHEKAQELLAQSQSTSAPAPPTPVEKHPTPPPPAPALPTSATPTDFSAQAAGDTIPDWLTDMQPETAVSEPPAPVEPEAIANNQEEIPEWLKKTVADPWLESEQPTLVSEPKSEPATELPAASDVEPTTIVDEIDLTADLFPTADQSEAGSPPTVAQPKPAKTVAPLSKPQPAPSPTNLNRLLYLFITGAVIIFILLLYTIFTSL